MTISILLDVITVAVVILFAMIGMRRGFIKSVVRLLGFAVSVVASALVSSPVAQWIYNEMLYEQLEAIVAQKVQEGVAAASATLADQINAVLATLPQGVQNLLTVYGVDASGMAGAAQTNETLVPTIMDQIISPLCVAALQLIVFLVLFLVLFLVIRLLGKVIDKIFASLPVIKQINGLLGGVLGFAEGVLVLFVLCFALQLYMTLTGAGSLITPESLEQTYLLGWVMEINPIL